MGKTFSSKIGIVDYRMGNIHSVKKAVEFCGGSTKVITHPKDLKNMDKIILPGVGGFGEAIDNLKRLKLYDCLLDYLFSGKIFLGICLGMQILFERSQEAKGKKGLAILKGEILRFKSKGNLKVPHMGWNNIVIKKNSPLLKGISPNSYVYFCHSYYPEVLEKEIICATTDYVVEFACAIQKENIYGLQFHPEKSQEVGLKIIKNFIRL